MLASALTSIALLPGLLTGTVNEVKEQTPLRVGEQSDRQLLVKMANEAIRRGPR